MAMAVLQYAHQNENQMDELIHARWHRNICFLPSSTSMFEFCRNFPIKSLGFLCKMLVFLSVKRGLSLMMNGSQLAQII